jgi:OFA family oxalate/formate antiporter-like MFS transporter
VKKALGLTRDQFSAAYMVSTFVSSLLLGKAGHWFDRRGAREVGVIAALLLATTLILSSVSDVISAGMASSFGYQHWVVPFSVMMVLLVCVFLTSLTMSVFFLEPNWVLLASL